MGQCAANTRDYLNVTDPLRGPAGFRAFADDLFTAFPDLRMPIEDTMRLSINTAGQIAYPLIRCAR
jgi:hypothetical protein